MAVRISIASRVTEDGVVDAKAGEDRRGMEKILSPELVGEGDGAGRLAIESIKYKLVSRRSSL